MSSTTQYVLGHIERDEYLRQLEEMKTDEPVQES
jgi:hypothetical protein